jgi:hypothetical protein
MKEILTKNTQHTNVKTKSAWHRKKHGPNPQWGKIEKKPP